MRRLDGSPDEKAARIAAGQHGVIISLQLFEAGLTDGGIRRRVEKGLLHRVYRGVYRFGHRAPSREASYLAAVLACGEGAVLGGQAAAFVYRLIKRKHPPPAEAVTLRNRQVEGVIVHRVRRLHRLDTSEYRGIRITTIPATLVALAGTLELDELARACHEAETLHRVRAPAVEAAIARHPNAPGLGKLHAIFRGEARVTLSALEREFLRLLRAARLPLPITNRPAGSHYVDCRWPESRLTVELDSYTYHHTRYAWEQDRRREREARARGDEFRRYTYDDVFVDRTQMLAELDVLLAGSAGEPRLGHAAGAA